MQDTLTTRADDPRERPSFHARRGALYGYAATALTFPDPDVLDDLRADEVRDAVETAASDLVDAVEPDQVDAFEPDEVDAIDSDDADDGSGLELVERVRDLYDALDDASDDEVEAAYNALFGLPGDDGSYPVVPYEAHYSTAGDVNETQRRIATIVGLLERFDLEPHDAFDERQDHVAGLLELAQVMATQRAVALQQGDADAAEELATATATVLDEHLLGFVPALAHEVHAAADGVPDRPGLDVYVAAADLASALVHWDDGVHPDASVTGASEAHAGETNGNRTGDLGGERR